MVPCDDVRNVAKSVALETQCNNLVLMNFSNVLVLSAFPRLIVDGVSKATSVYVTTVLVVWPGAEKARKSNVSSKTIGKQQKQTDDRSSASQQSQQQPPNCQIIQYDVFERNDFTGQVNNKHSLS
jgi:hypothetical protein